MDLLILLFIVALLFFIYKQIKQYEDDLKPLGIVQEKSLPIVGNFLRLLTKQENMTEFMERNYKLFPNEKYIFRFFTN
jgi:hypothetical protein